MALKSKEKNQLLKKKIKSYTGKGGPGDAIKPMVEQAKRMMPRFDYGQFRSKRKMFSSPKVHNTQPRGWSKNKWWPPTREDMNTIS